MMSNGKLTWRVVGSEVVCLLEMPIAFRVDLWRDGAGRPAYIYQSETIKDVHSWSFNVWRGLEAYVIVGEHYAVLELDSAGCLRKLLEHGVELELVETEEA